MMRSSLVLALVTLLFAGVVVAITDVCQITTADVKAATRVLNMWRSACEDHNWKGSTCYNYWAQLNEVMDMETNFQTCLTKRHQARAQYMLGTASQEGAYSADSTKSQDFESAASAGIQTLVGQEGTDNRAFVTSTTNNNIADTRGTVQSESQSTQATVADESTKVQDYVSSQHNLFRDVENTNASRVLSTKVGQETQNRAEVDAQHAQTRDVVGTADHDDEGHTRDDTSKQQQATRQLESLQTVMTQTSVTTENVAINATATSEHKATRENAYNAESTSRTYTQTQHDVTLAKLADETAGIKAQVASDDKATQNVASTDTDATKAFTSATLAQTRQTYSVLQTALQALYATEADQLKGGMWDILIKILVHYDLQGPRCEKFGETHTFSITSTAGAGRLEQLRFETNQTMVINEQLYGTNKVGYARSKWNTAESYYNSGNFRAASEYYRSCYQEAVYQR